MQRLIHSSVAAVCVLVVSGASLITYHWHSSGWTFVFFVDLNDRVPNG